MESKTRSCDGIGALLFERCVLVSMVDVGIDVSADAMDSSSVIFEDIVSESGRKPLIISIRLWLASGNDLMAQKSDGANGSSTPSS